MISPFPKLSLQLICLIYIHGGVVVVEVQDDRQGNGSFSRSQDNHQECEYLSFEPECGVESGKRNEIDIRSVQHQLDTHQHANCIPLRGDANYTAYEEKRCEEQERL
jgi:hypothetical protein